jgi:hypothetical protein
MNYTVIWDSDAEQELAALWLDPAQRAAVTRAANEIDQRLQADAPNQGESRPHGRRITFVRPLGVYSSSSTRKRQSSTFCTSGSFGAVERNLEHRPCGVLIHPPSVTA